MACVQAVHAAIWRSWPAAAARAWSWLACKGRGQPCTKAAMWCHPLAAAANLMGELCWRLPVGMTALGMACVESFVVSLQHEGKNTGRAHFPSTVSVMSMTLRTTSRVWHCGVLVVAMLSGPIQECYKTAGPARRVHLITLCHCVAGPVEEGLSTLRARASRSWSA
jgi:hypothetical protein